MKVAFVTSELKPFVKEGGLADVSASLPIALKKQGIDIFILLPYYKKISEQHFLISKYPVYESVVETGEGYKPFSIYKGRLPDSDIDVYFLMNLEFFGRDGVYNNPLNGVGYKDNDRRFGFFSKCVVNFLLYGKSCDFIHCNDYQTSLIPPFISFSGRKIPTMLTIHNLGYQGIFNRDIMDFLKIPESLYYPMSPFEYYGKVNFLKVGILFSSVITTVSKTYAKEIIENEEMGYGLKDVLLTREKDLYGIINGVDYNVWNPEKDEFIPFRYSEKNLENKYKNKKILLREFNFKNPDTKKTLISMIGRLVDQKGFDLVIKLLPLLKKKNIYFIILGTGLKKYHREFKDLEREFSDFFRIRLLFDEKLAHLIEAGSDIFLMPSLYEPCGLNQMYSLKYGTVPIVRSTGGLADTVREFNVKTGKGTGFLFKRYESEDLLSALEKALTVYKDRRMWRKLMLNGMNKDFSWGKSAKKYLELYLKYDNKIDGIK